MNAKVFQAAQIPSAWRTACGAIAHMTHAIPEAQRLVGTVEGESSSQIWNADGKVVHGDSRFDLIGLKESDKKK